MFVGAISDVAPPGEIIALAAAISIGVIASGLLSKQITDDRLMPVYWKPKYGTRSSRHRAWSRQQAKREAELQREPAPTLRQRLRKFFRR